MRQILKNLFILKECKIGEQTSNIYLLDTDSEEGLVLIDTGLNFKFKKEMKKIGLNPKNIKHCLITHGHYDHVDGCRDLLRINPKMRFYVHKEDSKTTELIINDNKNLYFTVTDRFKEKISNLKLGNYNIKCIHIPGHSPGGMAYISKIENKDVLFAGDICGGGIQSTGGNYDAFKRSLQELFKLKADILCDGHMKVISPSENVSRYIEGCLKINEYLHIGLDLDPKDSTNWYNLALVFHQLKIYDNAYKACLYALRLDLNNPNARVLMKKILNHKLPKINEDIISEFGK
ncbi:MAG: MBL fold metallo-hydrolase [Promethearchaeota archaeon]